MEEMIRQIRKGSQPRYQYQEFPTIPRTRDPERRWCSQLRKTVWIGLDFLQGQSADSPETGSMREELPLLPKMLLEAERENGEVIP